MAAGDPKYEVVTSASKPYTAGAVKWIECDGTSTTDAQKVHFKNVTGAQCMLLIDATGLNTKKLEVSVDAGDEYAKQSKKVYEYTFATGALTTKQAIIIDSGYHKNTETISGTVYETIVVSLKSDGKLKDTNVSTNVALIQL